MTMIIRLITAAIFGISFVSGNVSWIQCHSSADDPICNTHSLPHNKSVCIHFYYKSIYVDGHI